MSDMIDEALERFRNTKKRKAEGVVDGKNITIYKHRMLLRWKLSILDE